MPLSITALILSTFSFAIFIFPYDLGFGGDIYGLHLDYYKIAHKHHSFSLGNSIDLSLKIIAYIASDNFSEFLKFLQIKGYVINFIFCSLIIKEIQKRQTTFNVSSAYPISILLTILISFHPYFLSTILMGHTSFYAALPVLLALKSHTTIRQCSSIVILALVNPYLITTYLFILVLDLWLNRSNNKRVIKQFLYFLIFCLGCLVIVKWSANLIWIESPGRTNIPTGALPHHLLIPPTFSVAGFIPISFINKITIYSNVPEMFLFIGWGSLLIIPCLVARETRRKTLQLIFLCFLFYILLVFPPKTDHFGSRIYFPSYLNALFLEQLRMISRNANAIGFAVLLFSFIFLVERNTVKKYSFIAILTLCCLLSFPINPPQITNLDNINKSDVLKKEISISCGEGVEWTHYYAFHKMTQQHESINCDSSEFKKIRKDFEGLNAGKLSDKQLILSNPKS